MAHKVGDEVFIDYTGGDGPPVIYKSAIKAMHRGENGYGHVLELQYGPAPQSLYVLANSQNLYTCLNDALMPYGVGFCDITVKA